MASMRSVTRKPPKMFTLASTSANIFGGFLVTERMLAMYKKKG